MEMDGCLAARERQGRHKFQATCALVLSELSSHILLYAPLEKQVTRSFTPECTANLPLQVPDFSSARFQVQFTVVYP